MNPPEVLVYRCQTCGKWSHAQRKPKRHRRFVSASEPDLPEADRIERVEADYDHMNGFTSEGGWIVRCGPFDTYRAEKVAP